MTKQKTKTEIKKELSEIIKRDKISDEEQVWIRNLFLMNYTPTDEPKYEDDEIDYFYIERHLNILLNVFM